MWTSEARESLAFAGQRQYVHLSVILGHWELDRPRREPSGNQTHDPPIPLLIAELSRALIGAHRSSSQGCQLADSRLKLYWQAKLRSIDSCQNGTCADHYQKTNNVGSGSLRYTIWHFPIHAGRICLTHTRSLLIRIFAILMKVNWQLSN